MDTIVARLLDFAAAQPDALAFTERDQRLTYDALARRSRATAAWLAARGVRAGDTAALSFAAPYGDAFGSLQFVYALGYLGAVILPIYAGVPAPRRPELVARFRARWMVSPEKFDTPAGCSLIDAAACDWSEAERTGTTPPRGDAPERPFLLQFSGGTTGEPKVVRFTHYQFLTNMVVGAVERRTVASDRLVPARPWPTLPGLRNLLRTHSIGATFVNDVFPETRQDLERLIASTGATQLVASPWQLRRLLSSAASSSPGGPRLRGLYVGSAFVAPQDIEAARATITPNVYVAYASTETGVLTVLRPGDPVRGNGDVGALIPGVEAHAVDDGFDVLPRGTIGRLGFRAAWFPDEYVDNEQATARSFRDGWFYPGDVGAIDEAGRIWLHGRSDDVINVGGVKIRPQDIEPILLEHPAIADAAVIPVPHAMAGHVAVALIVIRAPVTGDALVGFLKSRIEEGRLPSQFFVVPEIFRSADGKILRNRLVSEYGPRLS